MLIVFVEVGIATLSLAFASAVGALLGGVLERGPARIARESVTT